MDCCKGSPRQTNVGDEIKVLFSIIFCMYLYKILDWVVLRKGVFGCLGPVQCAYKIAWLKLPNLLGMSLDLVGPPTPFARWSICVLRPVQCHNTYSKSLMETLGTPGIQITSLSPWQMPPLYNTTSQCQRYQVRQPKHQLCQEKH